MFQKVQSACCEAQPGQTPPVGEFPAVEGVHACMPHNSDPAAQNGVPETSGSDPGTRRNAGKRGTCSAGNCGFAARVLIVIIKLYQRVLSPLCPGCCRFQPTCSSYAIEALQLHGVWRGCCLTVWRLLRCQPFCRGGWDPVPPRIVKSPPCSTGAESDVSQVSPEQVEEK